VRIRSGGGFRYLKERRGGGRSEEGGHASGGRPGNKRRALRGIDSVKAQPELVKGLRWGGCPEGDQSGKSFAE